MKKCLVCGGSNYDNADKCTNCSSAEMVLVEVCPRCKTERDMNSDFCSNCGHMYEPKNMFGASELAKCPHCKVDIPVKSLFCPVCGKTIDVSAANKESTVKKIVCSNCSKTNDFSAKFCSYCFFDLKDAAPKEMKIVLMPKTAGVDLVQYVLVGEDGANSQVVCPNCESLNDLNEKYCLKCGKLLKKEVPKKFCSACGAQNPQDASFCVNCQHSFEGKKPSPGEDFWKCTCSYENDIESDFCIACGKLRNVM